MDKNEFEIALYKAYSLGQEYWRYADSENPKLWSKSDITRDKFESFVSEMLEKFEATV